MSRIEHTRNSQQETEFKRSSSSTKRRRKSGREGGRERRGRGRRGKGCDGSLNSKPAWSTQPVSGLPGLPVEIILQERKKKWSWKDSSVVKNTCCFCRRPEFSTHMRWFTYLYPGGIQYLWPPQAPAQMCTYILHLHIHTHIHITENNKYIWKERIYITDSFKWYQGLGIAVHLKQEKERHCYLKAGVNIVNLSLSQRAPPEMVATVYKGLRYTEWGSFRGRCEELLDVKRLQSSHWPWMTLTS